MSALLRLLAPLLEIAAVVFLARRRRLTRTLKRAGANNTDRAIALEASGLGAWWLQRLRGAGVIRQTPAGLYWLDPEAYGRYRRVRVIRVLLVVGAAFGAWLIWTMKVCCGP